jgi:hypothetical protein
VTSGIDSPSRDMSDWILESTASNWSDMRIFSSKWYNLHMPIKRRVDFVFDETVEEPFTTIKASAPFVFATGFGLSIAMGVMGREVYVPGVLAATFLFSVITRTLAGLGFFLVTGNYKASSSMWITTPQVGSKLACFMELNRLGYLNSLHLHILLDGVVLHVELQLWLHHQ